MASFVRSMAPRSDSSASRFWGGTRPTSRVRGGEGARSVMAAEPSGRVLWGARGTACAFAVDGGWMAGGRGATWARTTSGGGARHRSVRRWDREGRGGAAPPDAGPVARRPDPGERCSRPLLLLDEALLSGAPAARRVAP